MPVKYDTPDGLPPSTSGSTPSRFGSVPTPAKVLLGVFVALLVLYGIQQLLSDASERRSTGGVELLPVDDSVVPGEGGKDSLFGVPIKYDHSEHGATLAAINYQVGSESTLMFSTDTRDRLLKYIYTSHSVAATKAGGLTSADLEDLLRKSQGVDEEGRVLTKDGKIDEERQAYSMFLPEYGAFRVVSSNDDRVVVDVWGPTLRGNSTGLDDEPLRVEWKVARWDLRWERGDWRAEDDDTESPAAPNPKVAGKVSVSFAERSRLLPKDDGWRLVADAVEDYSAVPSGTPMRITEHAQ
jgi:hypothetical protein